MTPTFLLMDHYFSMYGEKMKKIYRLNVEIFYEMRYRIPFLVALRLCSARRFQMPLERSSVKTLAPFRIINATDSFVQHFTRIVYLR